jgi:hypothetical protein
MRRPLDMLEVFEMDQGSDAWAQARLGLPTASRFADILAKGEGKTRGRYLHELAAETLRGTPEPDAYSNVHMERGKAQEDEARQLFAFMTDLEPAQVGFIRNGRKGASPDSLIGADAGLEIKTALGHIQIERLKRGTLPPEHMAQVQGGLWVSERDHWHFMSYSPGLPPLIVKVGRDDAYIARLAEAVDAFNTELDSIVASLRDPREALRRSAA